MRILVCGSRHWNDQEGMAGWLDALLLPLIDDTHFVVLVHGDARGADTLAARWAEDKEGVVVESYPADWDKHGRAAGPIRNQQMLDTEIHAVIAFKDKFRDDLQKGGTEDMVRRSLQAKRRVEAVFHCYHDDNGNVLINDLSIDYLDLEDVRTPTQLRMY